MSERETWRVVDSKGVVHVLPKIVPSDLEGWLQMSCDLTRRGYVDGTSELELIGRWCASYSFAPVELVAPGQMTRAEAIAAAVTHAAEAARLLERERCAGWAAHVANEAVELAEAAGRDRECAKHHESRMYAAHDVVKHINSGEPVPR